MDQLRGLFSFVIIFTAQCGVQEQEVVVSGKSVHPLARKRKRLFFYEVRQLFVPFRFMIRTIAVLRENPAQSLTGLNQLTGLNRRTLLDKDLLRAGHQHVLTPSPHRHLSLPVSSKLSSVRRQDVFSRKDSNHIRIYCKHDRYLPNLIILFLRWL